MNLYSVTLRDERRHDVTQRYTT